MNTAIYPLPAYKEGMFIEKPPMDAAISGSELSNQADVILCPHRHNSLMILSYRYFVSSSGFISDFARQNLYSIVKQNNEIMDAELARVEDSSLALIAEQVLYEQYLTADPKDEYQMFTMEKKVSRALNTYFPDLKHMYSIHLITSYSDIGPTGATTFIPYEGFNQTALYQAAVQADGGMAWVPTFSFGDMFHRDDGSPVPSENVQLLAGVRLLKLFRINNGR